jgi:WD40-like Beta Propeller Repeat
MDRRHFLTAAIVVPLLAPASRTRVRAAADGSEIRGTLRRLTERGLGDNRATFTPDGKTLLFASKRSGRSQIWAMDRDGSLPRQIHQSQGNDHGRVAPSADGSRLCLSSDRSGQNVVYVLDLASGGITPVSDPAYLSFAPACRFIFTRVPTVRFCGVIGDSPAALRSSRGRVARVFYACLDFRPAEDQPPSSAGCVWQRVKLRTRIDRSWPTHMLKRILECLLVRFCRESFPLAQSLGLWMVPQSQPAQLAAIDGLDYAPSAVTVVQAPAASLRGTSKNRNAK